MIAIGRKRATMRFASMALLLPLLPACAAVDDPANIPKLGSWEDVTTVDSVTLDGRSIPEDLLPEAARKIIGDMRKTEQKCGEPLMRTKAEIEALMSERLDRKCDLADYNPSGGRISGMAHCEGRVIAGFDTEPTVKIDGTVDEDRIKLNVQSIIRINQKTGASNLLVMSGRRTFRRLSDC